MLPDLRLLLALLAWLGILSAVRAAPDVLLISSDDTAPYQELMGAFRSSLTKRLEKTEIVTLSRLQATDMLTRQPPRLIVTLGVTATEAMLQNSYRGMHLAVLVPRSTYEKMLAGKTPAEIRNRSAIYLDQPFDRFLTLARLTIPKLERVAVLSSLDTMTQRKTFSSNPRSGVSIAVEPVMNERDLMPSMQRILSDAQALLAIPDNKVYTPRTAELVILTAFRRRVPIIGFSSTFTRAGALCSIYSTPSQIGQQAGEIAGRVLASKTNLPPPQYPQYYSVNVNDQVARALDIDIDPIPLLMDRLRQELGEE
ncbi:ABC transporter substrate binding protein [Chitinivorax sp. B]|uniref:ABC transporter substrate-binding protein n=1 Tax=Chitinivorax sp. B TaxID=2502235 RepID=UPI0010F896F9|nr:ABC transporter substrate binding protein [Chitinivorax sp. B]